MVFGVHNNVSSQLLEIDLDLKGLADVNAAYSHSECVSRAGTSAETATSETTTSTATRGTGGWRVDSSW